MARILFSHSSVNNPEAVALREWLSAEGWDDVFLDLDPSRGIAAGERWERRLHEAANRCEAVLFLVSRAWLQSEWCLREFRLAQKLNKRSFGILIEPIPVGELPSGLTSTWQFVNLAQGADHQIFRAVFPDGKESHVTFSKSGLLRLKTGLTRAGLDARFFQWPPEYDPDRPPYRGMRPLEVEDAGIFFGREAPTIEALDRLRGLSEAAPPRFLVILGASGAGKSSFLRAGLLPRLARDDRAFLPLPVVRPERAGLSGETGLIRSLEAAVKAAGLKQSRAEVKTAVESGAAAVTALLAALAEKVRAPAGTNEAQPNPPRIVLAIDQAEELFLAEGAAEADAFLHLVRHLTADPASNLIVITTIRSDAYERLQTAAALEDVRQETLSLPPMPKGAYQTVIEGPATRLAETRRPLKVEPALTAALLHDVEEGGAKDALPLLAFTLERLYLEHGGDGDLRLSEYRQIGGIKGSIDAAVEGALRAADADPAVPKDRIAREALLRRALIPWLAGIDPETGAPRRRVARLSEIPEEARPLVSHLVAARLLATDRNPDTGGTTVEPAHEAVLRQWGLIQGWLEEDFAAFSTLEGIRRAARDWEANARSADWFAHAAGRLDDAEALLSREDFAASLDPTDRAYLAAARAADTERRDRELEEARKLAAAQQEAAEAATLAADRQRQVAQRTKWAAAILAIIAVLAIGAGILAWRAENRAVAALEAGTETAEKVVVDLARGFRDRAGVSSALVVDILGKALALQRRLSELGGNSSRLRNGMSSALSEAALAYLQGGGDDRSGIAAATAAATEARDIASRLVAEEPENAVWAGSLVRADIANGDALLRTGDDTAALERYREALAISEELGADNPTDFMIQRDLALSLNRVADCLLLAAKTDEALALYERSRLIREGLLEDIGENDGHRDDRIFLMRDLAVSYAKIADIRREAGEEGQALLLYQRSVELRQQLVGLEPENTRYLRDLAVGLQRLGAMEFSLLNYEGALGYFEEARRLHRDLTRLDPDRLDWKFDLSVSEENVGDAWFALGESAKAMPPLEAALSIRRYLVLSDSDNHDWKRSLPVVLRKIGDAARSLGALADATNRYRDALKIGRELVSETGANPSTLIDLVATLIGLSDLGDQSEIRLREALALLQRLKQEGNLPPG